jgi:proliferating cell nuclear antigen
MFSLKPKSETLICHAEKLYLPRCICMSMEEVEKQEEILEEEPEVEEELLEAEEQGGELPEEGFEAENQEVNMQGKTQGEGSEEEKAPLAVFEATIDAKTLRSLVETVHSVLSSDAIIQVTHQGISLRQMDSTRTVMLDLYLQDMGFYEFDVEQEGFLYLNLDDLDEVLNRAKRGNNVTLRVKDNKLHVIVEGSVVKRFSFPIQEPEPRELPDISLKFTARATISPDDLVSALRDAELFSAQFRLEADREKLVIYSGSERGDVTITFSDPNVILDVEESAKASYRIPELEKFLDKARRLFHQVTLEFAEKVPLRVTGTAPDHTLSLRLYLAPIIE